MTKKILKFVGGPRIALRKKVLEVELENNNVTVFDFLRMASKEACIHDITNEVKKGKYLVLLDGINIFYLNGLETLVKRFSTITIVHATVGG